MIVFYSFSETEEEKRHDILKYGIETDVIDLVDTLIKDKDLTFVNDLKQLFQETKNSVVREKVIDYFIATKDDSLTDYAVKLLEDPYDEKKSTVNTVFRYVSELKIQKAAPAILELLKSENEDYYDSSIDAIGKVGGNEEALFLASLLDSEDFSLGRRQALMRSLGEIKAIETFDKLVEIAKNSEENAFVRMYAAEAIGNMGKPEAVDVLVDLFEESDNNLKTYVIKGLSNFTDEKSKRVILEGFRDNYYKVRLESASAAKKQKMLEAVPYLIFRAKNDPELNVKYACYSSLGVIKTDECNDFLISIVKDKKNSETSRAKAATVLLENNIDVAIEPIITVARETLKDDKLKNLRYALGKEFAKYENQQFESICRDYLAHKDSATKGTGLDIYAKNNYVGLVETVKSISLDEKAGANKKKATSILEKQNFEKAKTEPTQTPTN